MGCPGGGINRWSSFRNLGLTDAELQGLAVFNDPNRGTVRRAIHSSPVQPVIRCSPTSATTTSASLRIRTTHSTACRKPGIRTGRTGSTTVWVTP